MLSRNPFGPSSNVRGDLLPSNGKVALLTSQGMYWVSPDIVKDNKEYVNSWKVTISKITCEHAGEPDKNGQLKVLSSLRTLGPNTICTDSYLIICKFDTEYEAENLVKNLPENSISKSGVCKGPKYFSYNGVSLYKLKSTFLKNKE